ncbi:unnamed protein product [Lasius platythorax]|uniref:Uncharacterized protein n=1 Tax=Lasius platythorax TaxID=488582 RepID=A0AAV2NLU3_9HYME
MLAKHFGYFREDMTVFLDKNASEEAIGTASEKIIAILYGAKINDTCLANNKCRFICFAKQFKKSTFTPSCLPPTADAARLHGKRVYYQIQQWYEQTLNPLE